MEVGMRSLVEQMAMALVDVQEEVSFDAVEEEWTAVFELRVSGNKNDSECRRYQTRQTFCS
jgi:predicted RNA-binding protein YlqC (UPF0109 family)